MFSSLSGQIVPARVGYLSLTDIDYSGLHKLHSLGSAWQMLFCMWGCTFEHSAAVCLSNNGSGSRSVGLVRPVPAVHAWTLALQTVPGARMPGLMMDMEYQLSDRPSSGTTVIFHTDLSVCRLSVCWLM